MALYFGCCGEGKDGGYFDCLLTGWLQLGLISCSVEWEAYGGNSAHQVGKAGMPTLSSYLHTGVRHFEPPAE